MVKDLISLSIFGPVPRHKAIVELRLVVSTIYRVNDLSSLGLQNLLSLLFPQLDGKFLSLLKGATHLCNRS